MRGEFWSHAAHEPKFSNSIPIKLLSYRRPSWRKNHRLFSTDHWQQVVQSGSGSRTILNPLTQARKQRPQNLDVLSPSARSATRFSFANRADRQSTPNDVLFRSILLQIEDLCLKSDDHDFSIFAKEIKATLLQRNIRELSGGTIPTFDTLRQAFIEEGPAGVDKEIKFHYYGKLANRHFSDLNFRDQANLADLRYPTEWYPGTRVMQREIHLHVGPTNSGKTYNALKRLEQAKSGVYAGPLRLLAHEVYTRLNANGIPCNLITGDVRIIEGAEVGMTSCTVEMVPVNLEVEVAVVDEIQMIGDAQRGWAWTQALLGLKAKEVHLCGEARAVPLIRELAAAMGDKLKIHQYERLNPLKTMSSSLHQNYKRLKKGDCVVAFSRVKIHMLRTAIEKQTGRRAAVVYGSLPPETRAQQAKLFNDPDNDYDFLIASDAIGMGLNLSIKRIIFESTMKFNGHGYEFIPDHHLRQIAGRAGRYRTAEQAKEPKPDNFDELDDEAESQQPLKASHTPSPGLVTTLDQMDLPHLTAAMQNEPEPVMSAGLLPPTSIILRFAAYFPDRTPFSYILLRLHELSLMHPRFHFCNLKDQVVIADTIEPVRNLTISDRIIFCASPVSTRDVVVRDVVQAYARCVANCEGGALLDIPELNLDILDKKVNRNKEYLYKLETLHKALILYIWLSYRFAGVFSSQAMAFYVKGLVEENIDTVLKEVSSNNNLASRVSKEAIERWENNPDSEKYISGNENHSDELISPKLKPDYSVANLGKQNKVVALSPPYVIPGYPQSTLTA